MAGMAGRRLIARTSWRRLGAMTAPATTPAARIDRILRTSPVVWLSTVRPDGAPHLVPIWFTWDGERFLIASKPAAVKVRNMRANPRVMLALGDATDDFDVALVEGVATLEPRPARDVLPADHLARYADQLAAIGLDAAGYWATYTQAIAVTPTRFLQWHGRTERPAVGIAPSDGIAASEGGLLGRLVERVRDAVRRRPLVPGMALRPRTA
jgi:PPOX class probable F420-dependent enzyme